MNLSFYLAIWLDGTASLVLTDNQRGRDLWSCLDEIGDPDSAQVFGMEFDMHDFGNPMEITLVPVDPVGPWQKPKMKRKRRK